MRAVWMLFAAFLVPQLLAAAPPPDRWKLLYNEAAEALGRGDAREAVAGFEKAFALAPYNPKILHGLIVANLAAGRSEPALQQSDRLLTLLREHGPDFPLAMATGEALSRHGQFAPAAGFFQLAQQWSPPLIQGRPCAEFFDNLFAALLSRNQQDREAIEPARRLIAADPGNPAHYYQLGLMLIKTAQFGAAYELLEPVAVRYPRSFEFRLVYALACYFTGRNEQAEKTYIELTKMRPDSGQPYFALGNFYADTGRDTDAVRAFGQAARIDPDSSLNSYMFGVELFRTQRIPEAAAQIVRALRLNPKHADSHYWLGKVYLSQDRRDSAVVEFETAVKLEPKHIGAYYQLALLYKRRGDSEKAREAAEKRAESARQMHQGIVAERMVSPADSGKP